MDLKMLESHNKNKVRLVSYDQLRSIQEGFLLGSKLVGSEMI